MAQSSRPLVEKTCLDCMRVYVTRARNNYCNACLHRRAKHPCADCGHLVDSRAQVCMPCWGKRNTGPHSVNWRGGRVVAHRKRGYVRVKVVGHPRADGYGYIPEHVFVMEQHVGRYLLPGENVHHRNGVRHDNRIANLELWLVSQPSGQRAVDLLAWAREILTTYEPVEGRL